MRHLSGLACLSGRLIGPPILPRLRDRRATTPRRCTDVFAPLARPLGL